MKNSIDTMTFWPRKIDSTEEIPFKLKNREESDNAHYIYSILFPPMPFQLKKDTVKMLILKETGIEYLEEGLSSFLEFSRISTIEWGSILLKGFFRIYHEERIYQIIFNSVRNDFLQPFTDSFRDRKAAGYSGKAKPFYHCRELEYLIKLNLKFFNIAGDTLSEKDRILNHFYQHPFVPGNKQVTFFTRYYTPYLAVELEREWIILKEDKQKLYKTGTYGWIKQYIAKDQIIDIRMEKTSASDFIIFTLKGNYKFRYPVSDENRKNIMEMLYHS